MSLDRAAGTALVGALHEAIARSRAVPPVPVASLVCTDHRIHRGRGVHGDMTLAARISVKERGDKPTPKFIEMLGEQIHMLGCCCEVNLAGVLMRSRDVREPE